MSAADIEWLNLQEAIQMSQALEESMRMYEEENKRAPPDATLEVSPLCILLLLIESTRLCHNTCSSVQQCHWCIHQPLLCCQAFVVGLLALKMPEC